MQRTESYTGIDGINQQDRALQETMGRIVDRSKEHLGPADKAIGQARRMLRAGGQDGRRPAARPTAPARATITSAPAKRCCARDADWHEIMAPDITKEKILQTV